MADESVDQSASADQTDTDVAPVAADIADATDSDIDQIAAKADNPDAVSKALKAERETARKARKDLDAALARLKEYEDRDKTEQEKLADRVSELEPLVSENLRLRVAMEKNLPAELIDRLKGNDREELEADADQLLALVAKTAKPAPRGSADQGARPSGGKTQVTEAELKNMSPEAIVKARREGRMKDLMGAS